MAQTKKEYRDLLKEMAQGWGLGPMFTDLIRRAVINDWSQGEFLTALTASDAFQAKFPGLLDQHGDLRDYLTGQQNATLSAANLGAAIANYGKLWEAYEDAAKPYSQIAGKISKDKLAALLKAEKSPDEFRANLHAISVVSKNQRSFDLYNQQRKLAGLKPLSKSELYKAISTKDQKFENVYEATRLQMMGDGILKAKEAQAVAKALPNVDEAGRQTGVTSDQRIAELVDELSTHLSDIGPELRQAGIDTITLARYIANPSTNPQVANRLRQLVATKRSRGAYVAGSQARKGSAGGIALYDEEGAASY